MTTNTAIDYTKLADTAAKTYTTSRDARSRAIANLAVVDSDRRGYQDIITADGHIDVPLFAVWFTQDEKEEIAQRTVEYYRAANKFEEYTRGTMHYFEDAMVASTALALIAEVHRLIHQDSDMGALLRELRDSEEGQELAVYPDFSKMFSFVANFECRVNSAKEALLDSASDTLRKAMAPYNGDAVTLMLIRFFRRDTDEHGNLVYDNHYFNLRNLPTLHDVERNNNMRASESKLCTYDTELTTGNYVEARERLSDSISRATKNMQERIKNGLGTLGNYKKTDTQRERTRHHDRHHRHPRPRPTHRPPDKLGCGPRSERHAVVASLRGAQDHREGRVDQRRAHRRSILHCPHPISRSDHRVRLEEAGLRRGTAQARQDLHRAHRPAQPPHHAGARTRRSPP